MAIYHLHLRRGRRGSPSGALRSAAAKASYVLRQGRYARGSAEVGHALSGHMPAWAAGDPALYWEAADAHERANASLFVELEFSLPRELGPAAGRDLALGFARSLCDRERLPYTLAVHRGGGSNPHCHLMISERVNDGTARPPELWFRRASRRDPAAGGAAKTRSLQPKQWLREARASWAAHANQALELAGHGCRIDHRTLAAQRGEALEAGDLRRAASLSRLPVHQSRASLALEDEDPDGRPGTAPKRRRRRGRRRRPGRTPTAVRAARSRALNAGLREAELAAASAAEAARRAEAELAEAAAERRAAEAEARAELERSRARLDSLGPRLDRCGDGLLLRAEDSRRRLTGAGGRLLAAGKRLWARIEDDPHLQKDLAGWAKSRGMTLWGRDPDEVLRETALSPPSPPADEEILAARAAVRQADKAQEDRRKELERDAAAAREEARRAEQELADLSFFRRRRRDLRAEKAAAAARFKAALDGLASLAAAQASGPDSGTRRAAELPTADERRRAEALERVWNMKEDGLFLERLRYPEHAASWEYPPERSLLFVVASPAHVPVETSFLRRWHHIAVWDPSSGPDGLKALRLAHPDAPMVPAPEAREKWPGDLPALDPAAADHEFRNCGLKRHIDTAEGRLEEPEARPAAATKRPERDSGPSFDM